MVIVRPAEARDVAALHQLSAAATHGVHTLARTLTGIERAVEQSMRSFATQVDIPGEETYLFVLEDTDQRKLLGSAAIAATAGSNGTFFSFRNDVIQQVSRDLNISHSVHALTLCADLTSYSQLLSFFVQPGHHERQHLALLSRARLMFAALEPQRFSDHFFVSLAGHTDRDGCSPFWEALGRKFFQLDFLEAERQVEGARNRTLIVELMPHYPIYVPLLPGDAQAAMGQVHEESETPFAILSGEGFAADDYVDIFDGGPILLASRHALRSFNQSVCSRVAELPQPTTAGTATMLVANARSSGFRAMLVQAELPGHGQALQLDAATLHALQARPGDSVLCVPW